MSGNFVHRFTPGTVPDAAALVLLHGSGGDEHALMPLAAELAPGRSMLAIRGTVSIDGGFAFFHRNPDRSIDEADLTARIAPLAAFIAATAMAKRSIIVGFSNGAIMAAALLMTHPALFAGAILFRPLSPFRHDPPISLSAMPVLIVDGEKDNRREPGDGARLAARLSHAGASVTHHVLPVGHAITAIDKPIARDWLAVLA
jgi:phospholipase/carboxylesterase